jgi:hypothetical protein
MFRRRTSSSRIAGRRASPSGYVKSHRNSSGDGAGRNVCVLPAAPPVSLRGDEMTHDCLTCGKPVPRDRGAAFRTRNHRSALLPQRRGGRFCTRPRGAVLCLRWQDRCQRLAPTPWHAECSPLRQSTTSSREERDNLYASTRHPNARRRVPRCPWHRTDRNERRLTLCATSGHHRAADEAGDPAPRESGYGSGKGSRAR